MLAHDSYDVPYRGKDDEVQADASDQVFSYLVCCVCPVTVSYTHLDVYKRQPVPYQTFAETFSYGV